MDFDVTTDLTALPATVESNVEELEKQLDTRLEFYKNLTVTFETVKDAENARADLNKLKRAIAGKRKEVKDAFLEPFRHFESDCTRLEEKVNAASEIISKQIKKVAEQVATEKFNGLQEYFDNIVVGMEEDVHWISLDRILNKKWMNATMKISVLKKEIWDTVFRMSEEAKELHQIYGGSPLYPAIWGKYLETYDKGQTLAYAAVLIQQEQQRQLAPPPMPEPVPQPVPEPVPMPEPVQDEHPITGIFRVTGTRAQIQALGTFIKQSGMKLEIIREKKKEENSNGSHE